MSAPGQVGGHGSPSACATVSAANGVNGAESRANSATRLSPVRTTTAARSGSVRIAVQGAASCRYSLPSTHSARSACADLRISIASN